MQFHIARAHAYLSRLNRLVIVLLGCAGLIVLAFIDYLSGFELSFSLFYVVPVSFVAWYAGPWPAAFVSLASAVAWEEANRLAGQTYSLPSIPYWNAATRLGFFVIIAALLSMLKQTLEREQALSRTDSLTGVNNRRSFHEAAQAEVIRARRTGRPLTIVYMDLDNFKFVNDRMGHETGDRVLRHVARTLRDNFRATDTVARLGGDEFGILLPETDDVRAGTLIGRCHRILLDEMRRQEWPVGFSVGVLTCQAVPPSVDEMIQRVDALMYEIKTSGKNATRHAVFAG